MFYEKKILDYWKKNDIAKKSLEQNKDKKQYSFYDGPPFATGTPHYGHILSSVAKDVVPRYWRMRGYFVPARWGWDCHGLPIEEIVERKLNISGKNKIEEMGIEKFNSVCRESVLTFVDEWKETIERIGRFVDFDNSYKTMDNDYIESVWWALKKIYEKELIYEDKKVLLYCSRCETPVSNFETAMDNSYKDITEEAIFVKFGIEKNSSLFSDLKIDCEISLVAWTTTPWTLPSNMALAVSKKLDYCLFQKGEDYYILADFFIKNSPILKKESNLKIIKKFKGSKLIGLKYKKIYSINFDKIYSKNYNKGDLSNVYKIWGSDFVTEDGTGIVHVAPMHGEDDFNLGKKNNLPIIPLVDEQGKFNQLSPSFLQNISIKDSDKLIKKDLDSRNLLFAKQGYTHSYPFCWRCDSKLFYYAIPSWFINIQKVKSRLIELNKKINWIPKHLKDGRFGKGLESAPDWNISRNRYWATPIPIWKCQNKKCLHQEFIGSKKDILKQKFSTNNYFFMRHAESIGNGKNILSSYPEKFNNPLTEKGVEQAKNSAKKIKDKKINLIISSPLLRAKETAKIIAKEINYPIEKIEYNQNIREIDWGKLNGGSVTDWFNFWDEKLKSFTPGTIDYMLRKYKTPIPDGESYIQISNRVFDFVKEINKRYQNKNILIISHGAPLKAIENILLSDFDLNEQRIFNNAEIKKIDFKILPYNKDFIIDFHRPYIDEVQFQCPKCGKNMERIKEVLDCWVESAAMPFAELNYPYKNEQEFENRFPADYISEYISQTRAWFYVMHVLNTILFNNISFKNCVCTGVVLNEKGEKMSKSKKNFPDPNLMLEKYGADALRLYLMSSPLLKAENLFFSERELKDNYGTILMLYNILSFYKNYLPSVDLTKKADKTSLIDNWLLLKTDKLITENERSFINYDIISVARNIKNFTNDFSWYLRVSRERLKDGDKQGVMIFRSVLLKLSKIIAPIIPFLADEIYLQLEGGKESVHLEEYPKIDPDFIDNKKNILAEIEYLKEIVTLALNKRSENGIKVRQPLQKLTLKNRNLEKEELIEIIKGEVNVKFVAFNSSLEADIDLDIEITEELKNEGILREVMREIQQLRKDLKLLPKDNIRVYFASNDQFLKILITDQSKFLKEESNIEQIIEEEKKKTKDGEAKEIKIGKETLFLRIEKI